MGIDTELVTLGKSVSRANIAHRALVLAELARSHDADLTRVGWTKKQTDELDVYIAKLETTIAVQAKAKEQARICTETLASAVQDCHAFLRKLRASLPAALATVPRGDGIRAMFKSSVPLRASQARLVSYLTQIRPGVEKLDSVLAPLFEGQSALAALDMYKTLLVEASGPHAVARRRLPESTLALNEAKGRLLVKIRELVQRAKVAFVDRPTMLAQFSLDAKLAGRPSVSKADPSLPATGGSTGSTPPNKGNGTAPAGTATDTHSSGSAAEKPPRDAPTPPTALVTTARSEPAGAVPQ